MFVRWSWWNLTSSVLPPEAVGLLPGRVRRWEEMDMEGPQSSMGQCVSGESGPYNHFVTGISKVGYLHFQP